jgi:hypothetical protein
VEHRRQNFPISGKIEWLPIFLRLHSVGMPNVIPLDLGGMTESGDSEVQSKINMPDD